MLYSKLTVGLDERAIVMLDGKLAGIREAGRHTVWHFGKDFSFQINKLNHLAVEWEQVDAAIRFQRDLAERCWQIVDSAQDDITVVWHKYQPAQVIPAGESRAFWRPEAGSGELAVRVLPKDTVVLPADLQTALLQQTVFGTAALQRISVAPHERLMVTVRGELADILAEGEYVLHLPAGLDVRTVRYDTAKSRMLDYTGTAGILRFQRPLAERYWQVVDSEPGRDTLVWHEQDVVPQLIVGGESRAFWPSENGPVHSCSLDRQAFELPEEAEAALLKLPVLSAPLRKYTVKAGEKMLLTVRGQLQRVYGEGEYVLRLPDDSVKVLFADSREVEFADVKTVRMWEQAQPDLVAAHFERITAGAEELVLYSTAGCLGGWVPPGATAYFWKQAALPYHFERINLNGGIRIAADVAERLQAEAGRPNGFERIVYTLDVPAQHQGLVYIDNSLHEILPPGRYLYWQLAKTVSGEVVDLRRQTCEMTGQELLSEDKVTLRVNAVCNYRITDAVRWMAEHRRPVEYLYRELQFAVRTLIGSRSIDRLLAEKQAIDEALTALMKDKPLHGIEIDSAGVKDIILPGEIRSILTRVVEAEKSAQANNIRRREETAATRSLLNTARVMEENPTALRLKELETLEKVTEKIDKISVYGGLDGVLNGLIQIREPK